MSASVNTIGFPSGLTSKPGFMWTQTFAPDRFVPVKSPSYGLIPAVRVTVRPGDVVYGGERSELATLQDANGAQIIEAPGTTQFFAFSVLVPTDWQSPQAMINGALWGIILQLHNPDDMGGSPSVAFNLTDRFSLTLNAANLDLAFYSKTYPFSDAGALNAGRWTDFVMAVTFATDLTGAVMIWRRNEGASFFTQVLNVSGVQTLATKPSATVTKQFYWKQGLYRSPSPAVTNVHFTTGLVRAPDFATAVAAAFGG